ncbi:hypothetical protein RCL_jg700.t1 [Rhizophagus clarus]|uniref:Uncharacterized protein n=1 Tax=Rhizophagus clarus TaxID=94130 RepID=A0A8H3LDT0_9GLOM|nr:hypothetical protein RCL_jg700.t1 [Rhizophagus clarus]
MYYIIRSFLIDEMMNFVEGILILWIFTIIYLNALYIGHCTRRYDTTFNQVENYKITKKKKKIIIEG